MKPKRLLSILLTLAMVFALFPAMPQTAQAASAGQSVTFDLPLNSYGETAFYLTENRLITEAGLLAGVSAVDETGAPVPVTVQDTDGLDLASPQMRGIYPNPPYIITYAAEHPVTGEVFTETRELYVTLGEDGIDPAANVSSYFSLVLESRNASGDSIVTLTQDLTGDYTLTVGRNLTIDLNGKNMNIKVLNGVANDFNGIVNGITLSDGVTLTLIDSSDGGTGRLVITNQSTISETGSGAGINTSAGRLIIEGGTVIAQGVNGGAGIGGGNGQSGGMIIINGGKIEATGGENAPGIGGTVTISGGTVTSTGGENAAGIGDGNNINISGGMVTAKGGYKAAGIGGGNSDQVSGEITIGGNAYVTATGGDYGAGIGGGDSGVGKNIEIKDNAHVTATGGSYGAGIGGGYYGNSGIILVSGGTITATGGGFGAGIGGGGNGNGDEIEIKGGAVTATGKNGGAGIGGGSKSSSDGGNSGKITISSGNFTIKSDGGAGIGAGNGGDGEDIEITGGVINIVQNGSDSAGIGGSSTPSGGQSQGNGGSIKIGGDANITIGGGGNMGIGGGRYGASGNITIDGDAYLNISRYSVIGSGTLYSLDDQSGKIEIMGGTIRRYSGSATTPIVSSMSNVYISFGAVIEGSIDDSKGEVYFEVLFGETGANMTATAGGININSGEFVEASKGVVFTSTGSSNWSVAKWNDGETEYILDGSGSHTIGALKSPVKVATDEEPAFQIEGNDAEKFDTLTAAINAMQGDTATILVLRDYTLTETVEIPADKSITIKSNNSAFTLHSASGKRHFKVAGTAALTLEDIVIKGNIKSESSADLLFKISGGGVENEGAFTVDSGAVIKNCVWIGNGGGIYNVRGTVNVIGMVSGNVANSSFNSYGGGIYNEGGTVTISGSVSNNASMASGSSGGGGGIYNTSGGIVNILTGGLVSGNITKDYTSIDYSVNGGGIYNGNGSEVNVSGSVDGNTAEGSGGGIYSGGTVNIENGGTVSGNIADYGADGNGGGIYSYGTLNIKGGKISNNVASYLGGGINGGDGSFIIENGSMISGNRASAGGGIYGKRVTLNAGATVSGNTAIDNTFDRDSGYGGGIYGSGVIKGTVSGNQASYGGGLYIFYYMTGINNTKIESTAKISGNSAFFEGGGLFNTGTMVTVNGEVDGGIHTSYIGGSTYINYGSMVTGGVTDAESAVTYCEVTKADPVTNGTLNITSSTTPHDNKSYIKLGESITYSATPSSNFRVQQWMQTLWRDSEMPTAFPTSETITVENLQAPIKMAVEFESETAQPITIKVIDGVTPPASDAIPTTTITETDQFTGTVSWNPAHSKFEAEKIYTATITLMPKNGYALVGIPKNFFTVSGATSVSNALNSGVITAVFPPTGAEPVYTLTGTATIDKISPRIGDNLTGSYTPGNNSGTLFYTWKTESVTLQTGTDATYLVKTTDYGKTITLEIISSKESGKVTSAHTAAVQKKPAPPTPSAPTEIIKSHNSVVLNPSPGYEYAYVVKDALAPTTYVANSIFGGLSPDTEYDFYQRIAETDDTNASAASDKLTVRTDATPPNALAGVALINNTNPRIGDVLTASLVGGNSTALSYQWSVGGTNAGTNSSTYTVLVGDLDKAITVTISATDGKTGTVISTATAAVAMKAAPSAPGAPTLVSKDHNSVTLTATAGYEYSKDGITWGTSNVFSGLTASTPYTFYQRVKETSDTYASAASLALAVTTNATPLNALTGTASISNMNPHIGDVLNGLLENGNETGMLTFIWKSGANILGIGSTYTVQAADFGKTISLEITSSVETGKVESLSATAAVLKKAAPSAPAAPTVFMKTNNSVVLNFVPGCEYAYVAKGNPAPSAYSATPIFGSLSADTEYDFYQRIAETYDTEASAASAALTVKTDTTPQTGTTTVITYFGHGGDITNNGLTYTVTPSGDCIIDEVQIDGVSKAVTNEKEFTHTFGDDGGSHSIFATFAYTLTVASPTNGALTVTLPDGSELLSGKILRGSEMLTITATPDNGYVLKSLTINGVAVTDNVSNDTYDYAVGTFGTQRDIGGGTMVMAQGTKIEAEFEPSSDPALAGTVDITINPATGVVTALARGGNTDSVGALTYTWSGGATGTGTTVSPALGTPATCTVTASGASGSISASVTVYKVEVDLDGEAAGDNATITNAYGKEGDSISIAYTVIHTDFGTIIIPNSTLKVIRALYGDTLRLVISKGSFKVALLDGKNKEIAYNNPAHPFILKLPYNLASGQKPGAVVAVDSKGTILPFGVYANGSVTFEITATGTYDIKYNAKIFTDISRHWAVDNIGFVAARDVFRGTGNDQFTPNGPMTRAMFATALSSLDGVDLSVYKTSRFGDVAVGQWYAAAVEWAAGNGIVNGAGGDRFDPNADITREQMAVMLYNYMKYKGYAAPSGTAAAFNDEAQISSWALEAVKTVQKMGIISGKSGNLFDPKATATRAEVATLFATLIPGSLTMK